MQETEFEINRNAVRCYFISAILLASSPLIIMLVFLSPSAPADAGITMPFYVIFAFCLVFGLGLGIRHADNFRYRLDKDVLRVDGGVFFLFRKSIPLERITDIALVQGPLLGLLGIWVMRIQTAGSAQCEAMLYGVCEPEKARELILSRRRSIQGEKSEDA